MGKLKITSRYATTPNEILNNKDLSLRAKGLYGFLQCKPEDWEFSTERIASQIKESVKVVRSTLQELEKFGLLTRELKPKDSQGKWTGYEYTLHGEIEVILPNPSLPKRVGRFTDRMEKGEDNSNKEYSKQDIVNNIVIAKTSFADTGGNEKELSKEIQEVLNIFYEINPTLNFGNKTQRKAIQELIEKFGYEKIINTVKLSNSIQGKPYAPVITTPLELKNKLSKLMIYYKREQEPVKGTVPNFNF